MHFDEGEAVQNLTISDDKDEAIIPHTSSSIEDVMKEYLVEHETYKKIMEVLLKEMEEGLGKASNPSATVKMFPTYVRGLPDGSEVGDYLALDLGGTNFRVLAITLKGSEVEMKNKIYPIAPEVMTGKGTQLFDHIASCIEDFMKEQNLLGKKLPLGFTFSFPCKQEGLDIGRLVRWTKGFNCEGVEGEDVVRLLHEAIKKKEGLNVECVAVLNDTVGCLMSCAFHCHNTEVGVILGTGTNACYMENLDNVGTWDSDTNEPKQVIINTEWGAFGDNGCIDFIRTDLDKEIDANSLNPGKQIYEKMISGMYMGEIVRLNLLRCAQQGLLFNGQVTEELAKRERFFTKFVSEIEKDDNAEEGYPEICQVLDELGLAGVSKQDCESVKYICSLISKRAAYLASAGIATLLNRINKPSVTVAVDGSLYRFHPHFHDLMMKKTGQLLNEGIKFKIRVSEDGSGRGAALVAAVAARLHDEPASNQ